MSVARSLERRLERLIEGVAGRVFSGRLHPSELAGKLAREADFARFDHPTGPATANLFVIRVNPRDLSLDTQELEDILAAEMAAYTAEEGLRLEGPVEVRITTSDQAAPGRAECHVEVMPGPPVVWAQLTSRTETFDIGRNRVFVGRALENDVVVPHDDISRRHALIYRKFSQSWLRDLSSANGTTIDASPVGGEATAIQHGSVISLASHRYRFVEKSDA
ncbi:MAG TPA: FhaA domain-containing protein [Acidimicrobiia bacterium]|nr:FhaA domain-containing protein [Acidimicrobiia bacterium]